MPRTILILAFGDLGDIILTIPAIRAVRLRYPRARLLLLAKEMPGRLVSDLGLVDELVPVEKHLFDRPGSIIRPHSLIMLAGLLWRLRRERIDTVVVFHHLVTWWGTVKYASLTLATGARNRVGLDNGRGWFLTRAAKDRGFGARHEAEYWLDVAALLDAPGTLHLEMPVNEADSASAERKLADRGVHGRLIAVHPGTGWYGPGRRWPAAHFAAAASRIMDREPVRCIVVGTELDAAAAEEVVQRLPGRAVSLVGDTTVRELAAILRRSDLLLANDGGVAHVAAAVGTPVVAVFGPSNDRAWRPLTATVVASDIPCRPCFYRDLERGLPAGCTTRECLVLVTPRMVADAALRILTERRVVR